MQIEAFIQLKHFLSERCGIPFCIFLAIPLSALLYPAFQGRDSWFRCNLRQGHTTDQEPGRLPPAFSGSVSPIMVAQVASRSERHIVSSRTGLRISFFFYSIHL